MTKSKGLSTIEVLAIVAILTILFIVIFRYLSPQVSRSRDAQRKSDLAKIKVAYENYFNDNGCYPDPDILDNCESEDLRPYMSAVPCDPQTGDPYVYLPEANQCSGYRLLSILENSDDPVIVQLNCTSGCGGIPPSDPEYADRDQYMYGVSEGVPVSVADEELETGIVCGGTACNVCDNPDECATYPMIYATVQECIDDANGCTE